MYKLFDKWLFQVNYYVKDRVEQIESASRDHNDDEIVKIEYSCNSSDGR